MQGMWEKETEKVVETKEEKDGKTPKGKKKNQDERRKGEEEKCQERSEIYGLDGDIKDEIFHYI